MTDINLSKKQKDVLDTIKQFGNGVLLFDDTSTISICKNGRAIDKRVLIPYRDFDLLEFMGFLVYEKEIGRDQYYYRLREL